MAGQTIGTKFEDFTILKVLNRENMDILPKLNQILITIFMQ